MSTREGTKSEERKPFLNGGAALVVVGVPAGDFIQGEIDYFTANQQRMDYRRYRELVCRSEAVPWRACKNVVAAWMK